MISGYSFAQLYNLLISLGDSWNGWSVGTTKIMLYKCRRFSFIFILFFVYVKEGIAISYI